MSAKGPDRRTSDKDCWETPRIITDKISKRQPLELDVAASHENALCAKYYTEEDDSLSMPFWDRNLTFWMNPPYSMCTEFLWKASEQARVYGCRGYALVPNSTENKWFHEIVWPTADEVWLLKGRIPFLIDGKPPLNPKTGKPSGNTGGSIIIGWNTLDFNRKYPVVRTWDWKNDDFC